MFKLNIKNITFSFVPIHYMFRGMNNWQKTHINWNTYFISSYVNTTRNIRQYKNVTADHQNIEDGLQRHLHKNSYTGDDVSWCEGATSLLTFRTFLQNHFFSFSGPNRRNTSFDYMMMFIPRSVGAVRHVGPLLSLFTIFRGFIRFIDKTYTDWYDCAVQIVWGWCGFPNFIVQEYAICIKK